MIRENYLKQIQHLINKRLLINKILQANSWDEYKNQLFINNGVQKSCWKEYQLLNLIFLIEFLLLRTILFYFIYNNFKDKNKFIKNISLPSIKQPNKKLPLAIVKQKVLNFLAIFSTNKMRASAINFILSDIVTLTLGNKISLLKNDDLVYPKIDVNLLLKFNDLRNNFFHKLLHDESDPEQTVTAALEIGQKIKNLLEEQLKIEIDLAEEKIEDFLLEFSSGSVIDLFEDSISLHKKLFFLPQECLCGFLKNLSKKKDGFNLSEISVYKNSASTNKIKIDLSNFDTEKIYKELKK